MTAVTIMFIVACLVFVVAAVICISLSFLFEEKSMTVKNHIKDIIRHEKILEHLIEECEQDEWKDSVNEELNEIYKHAAYIKHVLVNTK